MTYCTFKRIYKKGVILHMNLFFLLQNVSVPHDSTTIT